MHSHSRQQELISELFEQWSGESPADISALPPSGSDRKYFRIHYSKGSVIGAYNPIEEENTAFLTFTRHFRSKGLPVPEVLAEDTSNLYICWKTWAIPLCFPCFPTSANLFVSARR